jgi:hypothetical protein
VLSQLIQSAINAIKSLFAAKPPAPLAACAKAGEAWSEEGIKAQWKNTAAGKDVLSKLPSSTKFQAYAKKAGDNMNAYYQPGENTIYIPDCYTSIQAAPTAGHEALHAYQSVVQGRPKDGNDKIEMEVEAKNLGLNIYGQMGKPDLPYNYKDEYAFRERDAKGYETAVRNSYKKLYNVP